jgi:hypothetical protein
VCFGFFFATLTVSEIHSVSVGWINDEVERISENPEVGEKYVFTPPPQYSVAQDPIHLISFPFHAVSFKMD